MGKVLFAVCAFLALCIAGLALVAYLGRAPETQAVDNLLAEDLTRRIQTAEAQAGGQVDLAAATTFPWDRVLLVAPGTPAQRISDTLGYTFEGVMNYDAESNGLFVFERGQRVVRFADYRGRGRFEGFRRPIASLPFDRALLRVRGLVIRPG